LCKKTRIHPATSKPYVSQCLHQFLVKLMCALDQPINGFLKQEALIRLVLHSWGAVHVDFFFKFSMKKSWLNVNRFWRALPHNLHNQHDAIGHIADNWHVVFGKIYAGDWTVATGY
jgi:hypothetical protein